MAKGLDATTPSGLTARTFDCLPTNKNKRSSMRGKLPTPAPTETKEAIVINAIKNLIDQVIGRKNCKRKDLGLFNHSCPSQKTLWQRAFPRSPSRTTLPQICPRQLWEAVTPRPKEMKAVKLNDCGSMQFIPQLDLSTQIQVLALHPNPNRGRNQPTKLIPMQTHVASETTSRSLSMPLSKQMFMPVMNPSSLS